MRNFRLKPALLSCPFLWLLMCGDVGVLVMAPLLQRSISYTSVEDHEQLTGYSAGSFVKYVSSSLVVPTGEVCRHMWEEIAVS